jgi:uncharacterized protein (TIGR00369 family)
MEAPQIATGPLPFAQLLGIEITSASHDKVTAEMLVREDLCTQPAVLHGGAAMALADTRAQQLRFSTCQMALGRRPSRVRRTSSRRPL